MPIYSASVTSPSQFNGLTAATGLFDPAANTGGAAIQVRINGMYFSGPTAIGSWTLSAVDPSDGQSTVVLTRSAVNFSAGGAAGFFLLPTSAAGVPWRMTFTTTGMVGTGRLKIDYDFAQSEG